MVAFRFAVTFVHSRSPGLCLARLRMELKLTPKWCHACARGAGRPTPMARPSIAAWSPGKFTVFARLVWPFYNQ